MKDKIKVYLRSEKTEYEISGQLEVQGHPCHGFKRGIIVNMREDHERAKKIAEELAKEVGLEVEICDLANSFRSRMLALLRSIKTPAVVIGNKRVNGVLSKEKLLSLLDEKEIPTV